MLEGIQKAIRHPGKAWRFVSRKVRYMMSLETLLFNYYYIKTRRPKVKSRGVPTGDDEIDSRTETQLLANGFDIRDLRIDDGEFEAYRHKAAYQRFPDYRPGGSDPNFLNKALQHYVAAKLLDLSRDDVYIDVASSSSPVPEIYHELYGCRAYRQDLGYPEGIDGSIIGGDAGDMPMADGFATKMALHCSFEHFEGNADIRFIKEASRVLAKGGRLCIVPLYLFTEYAIQTNPVISMKRGLPFEEDAVVHCRRGWWAHGRFYDVPHLVTRVSDNMGDLRLTIHVLRNGKEIDPSCWVRFIALFEKPV